MGLCFSASLPGRTHSVAISKFVLTRFCPVLPFFHLLPEWAYTKLLKFGGESELKVKVLLEIRQTRITIERFNLMLKQEQYNVLKRELYFIHPNYEVKFGMKPRRLLGLIASIPYLTVCKVFDT